MIFLNNNIIFLIFHQKLESEPHAFVSVHQLETTSHSNVREESLVWLTHLNTTSLQACTHERTLFSGYHLIRMVSSVWIPFFLIFQFWKMLSLYPNSAYFPQFAVTNEYLAQTVEERNLSFYQILLL